MVVGWAPPDDLDKCAFVGGAAGADRALAPEKLPALDREQGSVKIEA